ncbi:hypothetical protein Nepgr_003531 [Nepenthes gracilis]|uniref:WRKY domain-containing protein n=1 Tax=Nepenthes gracilis TaxID=150966 RepID=A0AAD3XDT3_NEPGR|nr:hypothetical protein Nepgr_003531 [Nepenthes gracilis]
MEDNESSVDLIMKANYSNGDDHGEIFSTADLNYKEELLKSTKEKMREAIEENGRLNVSLERIIRAYEYLKKYASDHKILQEGHKKPSEAARIYKENGGEPDMVSLTLGRSASFEAKIDEKKISNSYKCKEEVLGLSDCKPGATARACMKNSSMVIKEETVTETWPPSKTVRSREDDDQSLQQNQSKKARVSLRVRCDTPTVQRCTEEVSILIITYQGVHNHPLPASAAATTITATTTTATSASATTPQAGASSSRLARAHPTDPALAPAPAPAPFVYTPRNGSNLTFSGINKPRQFYIPNTTAISTAFYSRLNHGAVSYKIGTQSKGKESPPCQQFLNENITAAPMARTSNTDFQALLAAAIAAYDSRGKSRNDHNLK